jgi:hypothetical protein
MQQQKLILILKDYSSIIVSDMALMVDFVKENYRVVCAPVCDSRSDLAVFLTNSATAFQ